MIAYLISLLYVFICLSLCFVAKKFCSEFYIRKALHILMASWWFIRLYYINSRFLWTGPLLIGLLISVYAHQQNIKKGMGHFCISLAIMTFLSEFNSSLIMPSTAAVLIMGYADASAAIFGTLYQKQKNIKKRYTFVGSFSFFIVCFIILMACFQSTNLFLLIVFSIILSMIEALVFSGFDNLTVPITAFLLTFFL